MRSVSPPFASCHPGISVSAAEIPASATTDRARGESWPVSRTDTRTTGPQSQPIFQSRSVFGDLRANDVVIADPPKVRMSERLAAHFEKGMLGQVFELVEVDEAQLLGTVHPVPGEVSSSSPR